MDLRQMQSAIEHNGQVLEQLIHVLGIGDKLRERLEEIKKERDEKTYVEQLKQCREMVEQLKARTCKAGPGTTVFGRSDRGVPLAVNFDSFTDEFKKLFEGADAGSVIALPDDVTVTVEAVFDLRKPAPPKNDISDQRRKGKRRR